MRFASSFVKIGGATIAVTLLASCSGTGIHPAAEPVSLVPSSLLAKVHHGKPPSWMRFSSDLAGPLGKAYISEFGSPYPPVLEYRENNVKNRPPKCTIGTTQAVNGIGTDTSGDLFVPWALGSVGQIYEYARHCGALLRSMSDPEGQPDDVAIDGTTAYVAQIFGTPNIEIYAAGATSPTGSLSDPSVNEGIGVAVDSVHDVFLADQNISGNAAVIEFPGGMMPGTVLPIGLPAYDTPGGILFDRSNNLLYIDQTASDIDVFAPPYDSPAFATISLRGSGLHCALSKLGHRLYCVDYIYTSVDAYKYPSGTYTYSYTAGLNSSYTTAGIAISPKLL